MKAGISTACFYPNENTENTIEIISKLGFELCEVFLEAEMEFSTEFCTELRKKADFNGINIYSVHPFSVSYEPFLFDRYERRRNDMEQKFAKTCKAAQILGAECYVFHGTRKAPGKWDALNTAKGMDGLCRIAGDYGIKIAWENVSWCMSSYPEFINEVKCNMNEKIYFTLDIKQAIRSGRRPEEYLGVYGDRIINFHINDSKEDESCLLPGKGDLDLGAITGNALELNEKIPFIIEVYSENYDRFEQLEDSKKYIESLR